MANINSRPSIVIITECPYSGILRAIIEHSKLLQRLGFKINFIVPATPRDRYGEQLNHNIALLKEFGKVLRSPLQRKYSTIHRDTVALEKLLKSFQNYIVFSYAGYAGKLCRLLYRKNKIPFLYHVPQCVDIVRRPFWQRPIESFFEHYLSKCSTYYIACSKNERLLLESKFGIAPTKIITIPNFIVGGQVIHRPIKKYTFAILGRVSKDKRVGNILRAARQLSLLDKFIVIGDGAELLSLKKTFPEVHFTGHIDNHLVSSLLLETKFIISNSIIEGLPFAIIESMHAGAVPIISDIPAHHDLITGNQDGFFFKDESGLKKILLKSISLDTEIYSNYSKNVTKKIQSLSQLSQKSFNNHFKLYGERKENLPRSLRYLLTER